MTKYFTTLEVERYKLGTLMNVTLKINEKNEIFFDKKWQQFDKDFFYKNFPNIKKLILKRTCHNKKTDIIYVPDIDFKMFSKLKNLETLGIIDDYENDNLSWLNTGDKSTNIYLNFLEVLKLKKLKKLHVYEPYISTKDLMKLFNEKAGLQEKYIYKYNLENPQTDEYPMIYEEEFDEESYQEYLSLSKDNIESEFEISTHEKDIYDISLVEVVVGRFRENEFHNLN